MNRIEIGRTYPYWCKGTSLRQDSIHIGLGFGPLLTLRWRFSTP